MSRDARGHGVHGVPGVDGGRSVARPLAVGGTLALYFMPPATVIEERSRGHQEISVPFGLGFVMGPTVVLVPDGFWFDLTPGFFAYFFWPKENSHEGPSLGGFGFGGSASAAYDIPLGPRLALGVGARGLAAAYEANDPTVTGGWAAAGTAFIALRSR